MRASSVWSLSVLVALSGSLVACAPADEEGADDQGQQVTGGTTAVESSVVYLFDNADMKSTPRCSGAILSDKYAVTLKACAKEGMTVGRAGDDNGKGMRARVKKVQIPDAADADIALIELDAVLGGSRAVITHVPLRDNYVINGVASVTGKGFFDPSKGDASSVMGRVVSETDLHSALIPDTGSQICLGDIGAPVCSSTGGKVLGYDVVGACGLSGLVVGPDLPAVKADPSSGANADEAAKAAMNAAMPNGCSGGAWNVVQLGRYADFIKRFAPEAFQPYVIDQPVLRNVGYVPDGLWGYKSSGDVSGCKIETTKLEPVAAKAGAKVTAKVMFANLQERSSIFGRFGVASKSSPTKMRWLPAKAVQKSQTGGMEATFEGVVGAEVDGDYIVAFRASASGGEAWTMCDLSGPTKALNAEKALAFKVGLPATPGTPTTTPTPPKAAPVDEAPPASAPAQGADDYNDDVPAFRDDRPTGDEDETDDAPVTKKKKKAASGCSSTPGTTGTAGLPMLGALLGLAALVRRRR